MEYARKILSLSTTRHKEEDVSFLVNGSTLLEELIVSFNGRHNIPIRNFTARELIGATEGFRDRFISIGTGDIVRGSFEKRAILVRNFCRCVPSVAIHDMVITSQMSHHTNVLKLLGCCLEFKIPVGVYEYVETQQLSVFLYDCLGGNIMQARSLLWKRRLRIAKDIANVVVYLHTAFSTPIIHRDIQPANIIIDQYGVAKLFNFSLCIALPPGESQMEDSVKGWKGSTAPEYFRTGIVTEKIDVYDFGVLLLQLLTGRKNLYCDETIGLFLDGVEDFPDKDRFNEIVDRRILGESGGIEQEHQLQAFLALALRCIQHERDDRPEMISVAKELIRIERSVRPC